MKKLLLIISIFLTTTGHSQWTIRNDSVFLVSGQTETFFIMGNQLGSIPALFDSRFLLSSGGQTGQILTKNSNTNFDYTWNTGTPATVGLPNVNNTSDANKPISTAAQAALDLKANTSHNHSVADVTSGQFANTRISQSSVTQHQGALTIAQSQVTNLTADLAGKAAASHTHSIAEVTGLQAALDAKQATLVSGTNIKTINGSTILGSDDLVVSGGSGSPSFINLASNFSSTSTTLANVTGWTFSVTSGKTYRIEIIAAYQSAALTTGGTLGINLSGGAVGTVRGSALGSIAQAAAATDLLIPIRTTTGAGSFLTTTAVAPINSPHSIEMVITFTCTTSGTFNIQWATEVNASAAQLNQNSSLIYQALN